MSGQTELGKIDRAARSERRVTPIRLLLPMSWGLASVGYFGPWVAHSTAALTLSGMDMGEFVKFLPGVLDGSLAVIRQLFYLPPLAIVVSVALLLGSRRLSYPWLLQTLILTLAIPVGLQLLPPAWSPASLMTSEFRLQTIALGISWLLLAGFWFWGGLPSRLTSLLSAAIAVAATGLCVWQFMVVKPAIDGVYVDPPSIGWGFILCMAGLGIMAMASVMLVAQIRVRSRNPWSNP